MPEQWKRIKGKTLWYEISDCGRVRRYLTPKNCYRYLKPGKSGCGYPSVSLGSGNTQYIHRLVALCFIGPSPTGKTHVNHIDANMSNNHVSNLEWVTPAENARHAASLGRVKNQYLVQPGFVKQTNDERKKYWREYYRVNRTRILERMHSRTTACTTR